MEENKQGTTSRYGFSLDRVHVSTSVTRNLGDYNSIKVTAGYDTDVAVDETVLKAYARAWTEVEREIDTKISEAIEALENA